MFVRRREFISRIVLAAGLVAPAKAPAAPPLITIQDVLYKADGTRFNGSATISWSSFEAADTSNITKHALTVSIVDGQFRVQLVPNADAIPAAYYSVRFVSDGKIQFDETWRVPADTQVVRLRDVRVAAPASEEQQGTGPIQIEDVVGLVADLSARPLRLGHRSARRPCPLRGTINSLRRSRCTMRLRLRSPPRRCLCRRPLRSRQSRSR
jgi:hypothetical protein